MKRIIAVLAISVLTLEWPEIAKNLVAQQRDLAYTKDKKNALSIKICTF